MAASLIITVLVVGLFAYVLWMLRGRSSTQPGVSAAISDGGVTVVRSGRDDLAGDEGFSTDVSTPLQRDATKREVASLFLRAKRRRLAGTVVATAGAIGLVVVALALPAVPIWWSLGAPLLPVVALLASHVDSVQVRRRLDARLRAIDSGDDELTRLITTEQVQQAVGRSTVTAHEMSIDLAKPIADTPSLGDPLPVAPSTYVNQPVLNRQVRRIDLRAPGTDTEFPVRADDAQDVLPFELDEVSARLLVGDDLPRAVGEG